MIRRVLNYITIAFALGMLSQIAHCGDSNNKARPVVSYNDADKAFSEFSTAFYRSNLAKQKHKKIKNIYTLLDLAKYRYSNKNIPGSVSLILNNIDTIKNNINSKAIIDIIGILLKVNEINSANRLLDSVNNGSDPSLVSNVQFEFAKYYYSHNNWERVIALVNKSSNDLPKEKYYHALFIQGISLQELRRHRKAISIYEKIPENSKYYIESRINMAVSDFRQDWWTDAQVIINKLLQRPEVKNNRELADRLYTTIGYSFLQLEYFRNSREALRNVSLEGIYTNQALLGISLNAGYQKDYVGALNAAQILNRKKGSSLEIDESYLLLPYFYEKLHQNATATAGYTNAINHYKNLITQLDNAIQNNDATYGRLLFQHQDSQIKLNGLKLNLSGALPPAFYTQAKLITLYSDYIKNSHIQSEHLTSIYQRTSGIFVHLLKATSLNALSKRKSAITDYMNQCRYGLARLYDTTESKKVQQP